jgi:hypothetical protein
MTWSVAAIGKAPAVKASLAEQFGAITCAEPEQTIKNDVAAVVAHSLSYFGEHMVVRVSAFGSMSSGEFYPGTVNLQIEPQWGFVE